MTDMKIITVLLVTNMRNSFLVALESLFPHQEHYFAHTSSFITTKKSCRQLRGFGACFVAYWFCFANIENSTLPLAERAMLFTELCAIYKHLGKMVS